MGRLLTWHAYRPSIVYCGEKWGFWFRIFGRGLHLSNRGRKDATFSERYGYTKAIYVFGVRIRYLSKLEPPK